MRALVTGGAGFIGSHLVDRLISGGYEVAVIDNLSSGSVENIRRWLGERRFKFVKADLISPSRWASTFRGADVVFHFAANPEVRVSVTEPDVHFRVNVQATFNVLEACRCFKVPHLVFASTSTVYGDAKRIPTPEDYWPLKPISVYGAAKLACETLIETYSRLYGLKSLVLRYANVVGPRMAHGVIADFVEKLRRDPERLEILGDGTQRKSYVHVSDAVDATMRAFEAFVEGGEAYDVYNVGSEDWVSVVDVADTVCEAMGLVGVEYTFKPATEDGRGWPGDVKQMLLDVSKLKGRTGWRPSCGSKEAVRMAAKSYIKEHPPPIRL